jgi:hypothetical protein
MYTARRATFALVMPAARKKVISGVISISCMGNEDDGLLKKRLRSTRELSGAVGFHVLVDHPLN